VVSDEWSVSKEVQKRIKDEKKDETNAGGFIFAFWWREDRPGKDVA